MGAMTDPAKHPAGFGVASKKSSPATSPNVIACHDATASGLTFKISRQTLIV
jgi:hypothetical protein